MAGMRESAEQIHQAGRTVRSLSGLQNGASELSQLVRETLARSRAVSELSRRFRPDAGKAREAEKEEKYSYDTPEVLQANEEYTELRPINVTSIPEIRGRNRGSRGGNNGYFYSSSTNSTNSTSATTNTSSSTTSALANTNLHSKTTQQHSNTRPRTHSRSREYSSSMSISENSSSMTPPPSSSAQMTPGSAGIINRMYRGNPGLNIPEYMYGIDGAQYSKKYNRKAQLKGTKRGSDKVKKSRKTISGNPSHAYPRSQSRSKSRSRSQSRDINSRSVSRSCSSSLDDMHGHHGHSEGTTPIGLEGTAKGTVVRLRRRIAQLELENDRLRNDISFFKTKCATLKKQNKSLMNTPRQPSMMRIEAIYTENERLRRALRDSEEARRKQMELLEILKKQV